MANMKVDENKIRNLANEEANKVLSAFASAGASVPRKNFKLWLISIGIAYAMIILIVSTVWIFKDGMAAFLTFLGIVLIALPMIAITVILNKVIKD